MYFILFILVLFFKKLFFFGRKRTFVAASDGRMCPAAKGEEKMETSANAKVEKVNLLYFLSVQQHTRFGRNLKKKKKAWYENQEV